MTASFSGGECGTNILDGVAERALRSGKGFQLVQASIIPVITGDIAGRMIHEAILERRIIGLFSGWPWRAGEQHRGVAFRDRTDHHR